MKGIIAGYGAAFFLLAFLAFPQNADVTILQSADAKEAKAAYLELKAAEQKWAELGVRLKRAYGIQYEAEFSKDFKAVVPKILTGGSGTVYGGPLYSYPWHGTAYPCYWAYPTFTSSVTSEHATIGAGSTSGTGTLIVDSSAFTSPAISPPSTGKTSDLVAQ